MQQVTSSTLLNFYHNANTTPKISFTHTGGAVFTSNVGIGTTNPGTLHGASYGTTRLHVDGGTTRGQVIIEGDAFAGIVLSDNGATANQRVFATSVDDTKYTIKPLNDNGTSTAGGVAFTVLHGGNVGIGTTLPTTLLNTLTTANSENMTLGSAANMGFKVGNTSSNGYGICMGVGDSGRGWIQVGRTDGTAIAYDLSLQASGGNVGIGTTGPLNKLVVSGIDTNAELNLTTVTQAALQLSNSDIAYGTFFGTQSSGTGLIQQRRQSSAVYYPLAINPYGGNVGIGTTSPGARLSLGDASGQQFYVYEGGDVRAGLGVDMSGSSRELSMFCTSSDGFSTGNISFGYRLESNGAYQERMRMTSGGNLGIGTTNPITKLSNSATRIGNADGLTVQLGGINWILNAQGYVAALSNLANTNNNNGGLLVELGSTGNTDKILDLESGGVNRVRVLGNGNVGIGVTSPTHKLHVKDGSINALVVTNTTCGNVGIKTSSPNASLVVKGNISYTYTNYTNVQNTFTNVISMAGYPSGLYQISIMKQTNASAYITAIIKWDSTAVGSSAGSIVNTIVSNQLGVGFNGSTTLQAISGLTTGTAMSANLKCLVKYEAACV